LPKYVKLTSTGVPMSIFVQYYIHKKNTYANK